MAAAVSGPELAADIDGDDDNEDWDRDFLDGAEEPTGTQDKPRLAFNAFDGSDDPLRHEFSSDMPAEIRQIR